jgi:UDP-N-acetyl-D-glucosamine/UDP-N-acetyl-D-galactosamine dehydrogenase
VLGLTFKENVPDLRNSRVPDILAELRDFGAEVLIHDALANAEEAKHEYGLSLSSLDQFKNLDAVILAVSHSAYKELKFEQFFTANGGVLVDVKGAVNTAKLPSNVLYWSL